MSRPLLTSDLPGTGGALKSMPEDFEVEELPAYLPSGEGDHLYLWIEKRGRDTQEVAKQLSRTLGIGERDVGYAGQKDRQAVTRQFFSVPASSEPRLPAFSLMGVRVISMKRHGNKLKNGHLLGNRFKIRIREPKAPDAAGPILEKLRQTGIANYFGEQRFGRGDDNAAFGKKLILGERIPRAPSSFQRKLYLSAFQSLLFNRALEARVVAGTLGTALLGDVLRKEDSGGLFVCAEPAVDQPRVDGWEVSPAGPMFGPKMTRAAQEVLRAEEALLAQEKVTIEDFRRGRGETEGARRAYRAPVKDAVAEREGADLVVTFSLPKGSYATIVLAELMK